MGGIGSGKKEHVDYKRVAALRRQGHKLQEIADRFAITRERVRQICEREGIPAAWNQRAESYMNRSLIEPFLVNANGPICLCCGGERPSRDWLCTKCKPFLKIVRNVKANLRSWKNTGDGRILNTAIYKIRKYGLKPMDLELV